MKIVVTGGRDYRDRHLVFEFLDELHASSKGPISQVIHGACGWDGDRGWSCVPWRLKGADRWADEWATERNVYLKRLPARWDSGPMGGPIRNGMLLDLKPDLVVAFPGGRGTANCVRQAEDRKILVHKVAPGHGCQQ